MNPSLTLAYLRLGKVAPRDAGAYAAAQMLGGTLGVILVRAAADMAAGDAHVRYAATVPGPHGALVAFAAEAVISFVLMTAVLVTTNHRRLARWTGVVAGVLVALYITFEAPLSGMSMNPARSFASAFAAGLWAPLWVYFTAPPLGMLAAAEVYLRLAGRHRIRCAKLVHRGSEPCIFRCGYRAREEVA
jgi:aquaporin Z